MLIPTTRYGLLQGRRHGWRGARPSRACAVHSQLDELMLVSAWLQTASRLFCEALLQAAWGREVGVREAGL